MTRTIIRKTSEHAVTVSYDNYFSGERVNREFWIPRNDGLKYVREGDNQVCDGLSSRGYALSVADAGDLLPLIRSEYQAMRRSEKQK